MRPALKVHAEDVVEVTTWERSATWKRTATRTKTVLMPLCGTGPGTGALVAPLVGPPEFVNCKRCLHYKILLSAA